MPAKMYLLSSFQEGALPGKGPVPAETALVGIAPSTRRPNERYLEPFGSKSHGLVQAIRDRLSGGLYVTNLVKTPLQPGKRVTPKAQRDWTPSLIQELRAVQPKRILTFGDAPARVLCPGFTGLREDHGTLFFNVDLGAIVVPTYHPAAAYRNPQFKDLLARDLRRFVELTDGPPSVAMYNLITIDELEPFTPGSSVYLDVETDGLDTRKNRITMVGFREGAEGPISIIRNPKEEDLRRLGKLLHDAGSTLIGHNLQFDLGFLVAGAGGRWPHLSLRDTMLMAHTSGEEVLNLKHLTTFYTDRPGSRFGGGISDPLYLAEDVASTQAIEEVMLERQKELSNTFALKTLYRLIPHVVKAKLIGVYVDREMLQEINADIQVQVEETIAELNELAGTDEEMNWASPQQVIPVLRTLGVPLVHRTKSGQYSVAEKALLPFVKKYPVVEKLLGLRALNKLEEYSRSYIEHADENGYLHPSLNLAATVTGRLSCRNPNLQQVPREGPLKLAFRPADPVNFIYGLMDLSQAELRVAALLSNDEKLAHSLLSEDAHRAIAAQVYNKPQEAVSEAERKASKKITFGLLYGGSVGGLAERAGLSPRAVQRIIDSFFNQFPGLARWIEAQKRIAGKTQYLRTLFGRTRDLRNLYAIGDAHAAERRAINTPIQSLASDIVLAVLVEAAEYLREHHAQSRFLFGVHDSVIFEIHRSETMLVAQAIEQGFLSLKDSPLASLPLWNVLPIVGDMSYGESWASVEETNAGYAPLGGFGFSSHTGITRTFVTEENSS